MINTLKSHNLLFRDGTSQQDRKTEAIQPDYIPVDDRNLEELIAEAQRLAKELRFFDEHNNPVATWESFLIDDPIAYSQNSTIGKEIQQKQWAHQLATYVENPDRFLKDKEMMAKLSRPHVVLFMTFIKLLNHVKSQINGLTQKHLDFYFRERLGLTPKEAIPDVVNVVLELAENIEYLEVKKGTVLDAGEDASGNQLQYQTHDDTSISKAKITQLKNVFVEKEFLTIKEAHLKNRDNEDLGLTDMMQMAVGHPNPGNPIPDLPTEANDLIVLENLSTQSNPNPEAISYITEKLFLSVQDFSLIIKKHQEEKEGIPADWKEVYNILDRAYKDKIKNNRQQQLNELNEKEGFDTMLRYVYGNPLPGDQLPLYKGEKASFDIVFDDLKSSNVNSEEALEYIEEELKLKEQDFIHIVQTNKGRNIPVEFSEEGKLIKERENWSKVYRLLELSDRQIRSVSLPSPSAEKLSDVYTTQDARAFAFSQYGDDQESKRFKTFGNRLSSIADHSLKPSEIGFAVSSPTLILKEGKRKIEVLLDVGLKDSDIDTFQSIFEKNDTFQLHLSSNSQWFTPNQISFTLGNYVGVISEDIATIDISDQTITITDDDEFSIEDVGRYIVNNTNEIYEILEVKSSKMASVRALGNVDVEIDKPQKFESDQVYLNALKIEIILDENDLPVLPLASDEISSFIKSDYPSLVGTLNHTLKGQTGQERYRSEYQNLMNLELNKVHLRVDVQNLQQITLQNDQNTIDPKKPFEPFGFEPETGNSFYLANEEICRKKLDQLHLDMQWMKLPKSFKEHYKNYWLIDANNSDLPTDAYTIQKNSDFKANMFLCDKNTEVLLPNLVKDIEGKEVAEGIALFPDGGKISITDVPSRMQHTSPEYLYKQDADAVVDKEEVVDWDRYFRIELEPFDFQNELHNTLFARQALSTEEAIKNLKINPPYQPKLKKIKVGYSAYTDFLPEEKNVNSIDKLFHIHPFGFDLLGVGKKSSLLPTYEDEGLLYLGIDQLILPQVVSILFQMAEGSANPDIEKPDLQWSYLRDNDWVDLETSAILFDTTNGLINSGIVKINIPSDATKGGTLMPDALHWLKICAGNNITGISDTIDIRSQVISATLSSTAVNPLHFENPLAANTITETLNPIPEIAAIKQPFTSSKGKPTEQGSSLYKRFSERLRHKNRALTMWDYEHLVLNEFPQVYKAKCLPSGDELGSVAIIVVPDIKGRLPFNPFAPKVPADTLFQIHKYLNNHAPAYAAITVSNPLYLQVAGKCVVKFHAGFDVLFYKEKLIEEIKRFLSPWAYDQDSDINIGGTLHASVIINFIAERPYIDYVANLKLFQSEDGETFTDVRSVNDGKSVVVPSRPDMVLVSAQSHDIAIVDENGYQEDSFEGINHMVIGKDFTIPEELL